MLLNRVVYRFSEGLTNTTRLSSKPGRVGVGGPIFGSYRACHILLGRASAKSWNISKIHMSKSDLAAIPPDKAEKNNEKNALRPQPTSYPADQLSMRPNHARFWKTHQQQWWGPVCFFSRVCLSCFVVLCMCARFLFFAGVRHEALNSLVLPFTVYISFFFLLLFLFHRTLIIMYFFSPGRLPLFCFFFPPDASKILLYLSHKIRKHALKKIRIWP